MKQIIIRAIVTLVGIVLGPMLVLVLNNVSLSYGVNLFANTSPIINVITFAIVAVIFGLIFFVFSNFIFQIIK